MALIIKTPTVDINSPLGLFATIYINVIGIAVFIVQPGFNQLLVSLLQYSPENVGYIASAEMWGIALTTVALNFLAKLVSWRPLLAAAALLIMVGNLGSIMAVSAFEFATWRFIAGVGSGALISLTFTIIGLTDKPDRNFGFTIMGVLIYGSIGLLLVPVAGAAVGVHGIIIFFALLGLSVFPFIRFLPNSGESHHQVKQEAIKMPELQKYLGICGMFFYFAGQGIIWAYLFLIGTNAGSDEQAVANSLALSQFLGIGGAFLAAMIGLRFGRIKPITLGVMGGIIPLFFLFDGAGIIVYLIAVCVYNFAWNMLHPYLLAAMASFEAGGRIVTYGVSGQMIGLAVGPALAAFVLNDDDFTNVLALGIVTFALSLCFVLVPVLTQKKLLAANSRR